MRTDGQTDMTKLIVAFSQFYERASKQVYYRLFPSTNLMHTSLFYNLFYMSVAYPGILFGGGSINSVEDRGQRERGSGGGSPLVRGSGGSCNLAQEISFHIVKFS